MPLHIPASNAILIVRTSLPLLKLGILAVMYAAKSSPSLAT
jgi:hypothetical protein